MVPPDRNLVGRLGAGAPANAVRSLQAPWSAPRLLGALLLITAAATAYCLAYNAFAGSAERLDEAALWTVVNVLPWVLAFEAGKRSPGWRDKSLVLLAAAGGSILLGVMTGTDFALEFELVRRMPGLLVCAALLAAVNLRRAEAAPADAGQAGVLPLSPDLIDWVVSAGNYVELHGGGRTIVHRCSLARAQAELLRHGFVRIHRSTLVRRDRIARVRRHDVILADGRSLPIGKRYRSGLTSVNFVPSSRRSGSREESGISGPS